MSRTESMESVVRVLDSAQEKGVRIWSENGQLRYRAPQGALSSDELRVLRGARDRIVAHLQMASLTEGSGTTGDNRAGAEPVPLAFSQLAHWNLYQLGERNSMRAIASAIRLRGELVVRALQETLTEMISRHSALRTKVIVADGLPFQTVSTSTSYELQTIGVTSLPDSSREIEVSRLIEELILEPVNVVRDPLFAVRLIDLGNDEHVLAIAIEHIVSDAFSASILLRDLITGYSQLLAQQCMALPEVSLQFIDYARLQRANETAWLERHRDYWERNLLVCPRVKFPVDQRLGAEGRTGWGSVPVRIGAGMKVALTEWSRRMQTTLVMSVFTAYVATVLRWCNASDCTFEFQSDGRYAPNLRNTIGYFASALHVRASLSERDTFVDLLNRVKDEYCLAYEHADYSYWAAQVPSPDFTGNTVFNWLPAPPTVELVRQGELNQSIECSPIRFSHPMLRYAEFDHEPGVLLYDTGAEIVGYVYFPLNRFSIGTMERFVRNFVMFTGALLRLPRGQVRDLRIL